MINETFILVGNWVLNQVRLNEFGSMFKIGFSFLT